MCHNLSNTHTSYRLILINSCIFPNPNMIDRNSKILSDQALFSCKISTPSNKIILKSERRLFKLKQQLPAKDSLLERPKFNTTL